MTEHKSIREVICTYLLWVQCHRWPRCTAGTAGLSSLHLSGQCTQHHILVVVAAVLYSTASENTIKKTNTSNQSFYDPDIIVYQIYAHTVKLSALTPLYRLSFSCTLIALCFFLFCKLPCFMEARS